MKLSKILLFVCFTICITVSQASINISLELYSEKGLEYCDFKPAYGLDFQIIETYKYYFPSDVYTLPEDQPYNFAYDEHAFNLLACQEMKDDIIKAQQQRNTLMKIQGTLIPLAQQYLNNQWNSVLADKKCGSNSYKIGQTNLQSGLMLEVEDHEDWKPYLENNNFAYSPTMERFVYSKCQNVDLIPTLRTSFLKIFDQFKNTELLDQTKVAAISNGPDRYIEALAISPIAGFSVPDMSPESLKEESLSQFSSEMLGNLEVNAEKGVLLQDWEISNHFTDLMEIEGKKMLSTFQTNLKHQNSVLQQVSCGSDLCEERIYETGSFTHRMYKRITNLKPHHHVRIEFKGRFQGRVSSDDYIQIEVKNTDLKVKSTPYGSNIISLGKETRHYDKVLEIEIICQTTESPESKGCAYENLNIVLQRCRNDCILCSSYDDCNLCQEQGNRGSDCKCKAGYLDNRQDYSCEKMELCKQNYLGPFDNYFVYDYGVNIDRSESEQNFPSLSQAMTACDSNQDCKAITYSKKGLEQYAFQLRYSTIIVAQKDLLQARKFEDGPSISWTKNENSKCCYARCSDCFKPKDSQACLSCKSGYFLKNNECVWDCGLNFWKNTSTGKCEACHKNCRMCENSGWNYCLSCHPGAFLKAKTTLQAIGAFFGGSKAQECVGKCPLGKGPNFEENWCEDCHSNCKECLDLTNKKCPQCSDSAFRFKDLECVSSCPVGYSENTQTRVCEQCHVTCLACNGPEKNQCVECKSGEYLDLEDHTCSEDCGKKTLEQVSGEYTKLMCTSVCPDEYLLHGNVCVLECPEGTQVIPERRICGKCTDIAGMKHQENICVSSCHEGFYEETETQCSSCNPICQSCDGPSITQCTSCVAPMVLMNGRCKELCKKAQYFEKPTEICRNCFSSCGVCEDSTHKCLECDAKFPYYININEKYKKCFAACPPGHKKVIKEDSWEKGSIECFPCDPSSDPKCKPKKEQIRCPFGQTYESNRCVKCTDINCLSCSKDKNTCEICNPSYYLSNEGSCSLCHQNCESCKGPLESDCLTCATGTKKSEENSSLTCSSVHKLQADHYKIDFQNLQQINQEDLKSLKLTTEDRCTKQNIKQTGKKFLIRALNKPTYEDCTEFESSDISTQSQTIQDLYIFSTIAINQGLDQYTPSFLNSHLLSATNQIKNTFNINHKQKTNCKFLSCSYKIHDQIVLNQLKNGLVSLKIQKEQALYLLKADNNQRMLDKEVKHAQVVVKSQQIKEVQEMISQQNNDNVYYVFTLAGVDSQDKFQNNLKCIVQEQTGENYQVYCPKLGESIQVQVGGGSNDVLKHYNVRKVQKIVAEKVEYEEKIALRVDNMRIDDQLCIKEKQIKNLFVEINRNILLRDFNPAVLKDYVNEAQKNEIQVDLVYNYCKSQSAAQVVDFVNGQEEIKGKYNRLWIDVSSSKMNEIDDSCKLSKDNLDENISQLKNLIQALKEEQISVGIYSSQKDWDVYFADIKDFADQDSGVAVWYQGYNEEVLNVRDWKQNVEDNLFRFGGWEVSSGKSFQKQYEGCGNHFDLISL